MSGGIFGSLFDFNGDGELDAFEQGMEFMALQEMMKWMNWRLWDFPTTIFCLWMRMSAVRFWRTLALTPMTISFEGVSLYE